MRIRILSTRAGVSAALAGILVFALTSCTSPDPHAVEIDRLARSLHDAGEFDGVILVAEAGKVIYREAFGTSDCESGEEHSPNTIFDLASITKPFTATAVLMLVEEGKVDLHSPVQTYLPDVPYLEVTVEHLLTHTSGLPNYVHNPQFLSYLKELDEGVALSRELIQWLADVKPELDFTPGEDRRYSNTGFVLLGCVVDAVSGLSYEEFLQTRIFSSLGMQRTFVWTDPHGKPPAERWSHGHERSLDRTTRTPYDSSGHSSQLGGIRGANGVFSTVDDLFIFDQALYTDKLISPDLLAKAFRRFRLADGTEEPYGYGWINRAEVEESQLIWHGGQGGGYLTSFHRDLESLNTVIVLSNSSTYHLTIDEFADAILDILHDRNYQEPRIPISHPIAEITFAKGADAAVALYQRFKADAQDEYFFNEYELNVFGYRLMWEDYPTEAVTILKLNAQEYPDSANVYDCLGDAYAKVGDSQLAVASYQKALELDPTLEHTRRKLSEIAPDRVLEGNLLGAGGTD